jgi:hypothetical protein
MNLIITKKYEILRSAQDDKTGFCRGLNLGAGTENQVGAKAGPTGNRD